MKSILGFMLLVIATVSCTGTKEEEYNIAAEAAYSAKFPSDVDTSWNYKSLYDKMTDDTTYSADVLAKQKLQFASPYDGGVSVKLNIRKDAETNVFVSVDQGIFNMSSNGGNKVKCRFDKDKAIEFKVVSSSDHSSNVIFISDTDRFLSEVKKHKSLIIEAEFYQEGFRQMDFNIADFKLKN